MCLPDHLPAVCPACGRDLNQAGTWSQLAEWPKVRDRGFWRYVLVKGVLPWGLLAVLVTFGTQVYLGKPMLGALLAASWTFGGFVYGLLCWTLAETEYAAAQERLGATDSASERSTVK
jgi:hypothetical protein